ncbi:MAG: 50S ribosomal protein L10 [Verrucomicrobiota bacterium]|jgi:large subunit ribosomal protein L10
MRAEKQCISSEYVKRLNASPFFIVVDYRGLKVGPITELRKRLGKAGAEMHVVKNSLFRLAVKEAGVVDLGTTLAGQLAVVTGPKDISSAAKVVKTFGAEFDKPKIKFGYLKNQRLETAEILVLADLPSLEIMRGRVLGVLSGPATKLAVLLNTPGTQLARVLKGRQEKQEKQEKPEKAEKAGTPVAA